MSDNTLRTWCSYNLKTLRYLVHIFSLSLISVVFFLNIAMGNLIYSTYSLSSILYSTENKNLLLQDISTLNSIPPDSLLKYVNLYDFKNPNQFYNPILKEKFSESSFL